MIDDMIHIAIKSYKRAGGVTTHEVVPEAWIWVPESQADAYERFHPGRVITIPDEADGSVPRKLNAILDRSPCPWTLILDDDISAIGRWETNRERWLKPGEVLELIEHYFPLADAMGCRLWGVSQLQDPGTVRVYTPFNLLCPVLGPWQGHLAPELRYDEAAGAKEDYDFWLQNIHRYRRALRVNKYHYIHDHNDGKPGGLMGSRSMEFERRSVQRMLEKWGPKVFRSGGTKGRSRSTGDNILNSRISQPIPGC